MHVTVHVCINIIMYYNYDYGLTDVVADVRRGICENAIDELTDDFPMH